MSLYRQLIEEYRMSVLSLPELFKDTTFDEFIRDRCEFRDRILLLWLCSNVGIGKETKHKFLNKTTQDRNITCIEQTIEFINTHNDYTTFTMTCANRIYKLASLGVLDKCSTDFNITLWKCSCNVNVIKQSPIDFTSEQVEMLKSLPLREQQVIAAHAVYDEYDEINLLLGGTNERC